MSKVNWRVILVLVVGLGSVTGAGHGDEIDLSGTWTMTMLRPSPTGDKEAELVIEQDGFSLTVSMRGESGEVECVGYLDGVEIRFYCVAPGKKGDTVVKYGGHVRGDLIGGEVDLGKQGLSTWKATRGPEEGVDLGGTWTLQMRGDSPSGMNLAKMNFRQEGHNLVVTLESERGSVECEGFVAGRLITFFYVRPTNGDQIVARFTGQLAGAFMGGEVDMGKLGKTTWRATQNV
jgi:hypothetical protein